MVRLCFKASQVACSGLPAAKIATGARRTREPLPAELAAVVPAAGWLPAGAKRSTAARVVAPISKQRPPTVFSPRCSQPDHANHEILLVGIARGRQGLRQAERHRGVVGPLARREVEWATPDRCSDGGPVIARRELERGPDCIPDGKAEHGAESAVAGSVRCERRPVRVLQRRVQFGRVSVGGRGRAGFATARGLAFHHCHRLGRRQRQQMAVACGATEKVLQRGERCRIIRLIIGPGRRRPGPRPDPRRARPPGSNHSFLLHLVQLDIEPRRIAVLVGPRDRHVYYLELRARGKENLLLVGVVGIRLDATGRTVTGDSDGPLAAELETDPGAPELL